MIGILILAIFFFTTVTCYPYNQIRTASSWRSSSLYPKSCCQLEWKVIGYGEHLPKDYVKAGSSFGRDWAYTFTVDMRPAFKSDQPSEEPNWLRRSLLMRLIKDGDGNYPSYPWWILTNPNKCSLGWYRKRFAKELPPDNDDWYFPTLGYSRYGDFARYLGEPSASYPGDGDLMQMTSLSNWKFVKASNFEILYVDCKESIKTMAGAKLYNISYENQHVDKVESSPTPVIYNKKIVINDGPEPTKALVEFEVETFDNASIKITDRQFSLVKTTDMSYTEWNLNASLPGPFKLLEWLGFGEVGLDVKLNHMKGKFHETFDSRDKTTDLFKTSTRRDKFKSTQTVVVPAYSKSALTAYTVPVRGSIPFAATYELMPPHSKYNDNVEILQTLLRRYGMNKNVTKSNRGSILTSYDGAINLDAGHEVTIDIRTTKFDAPDENEAEFYNRILTVRSAATAITLHTMLFAMTLLFAINNLS